MKTLLDFIRGIVRPLLALSTWMIILGMAWTGRTVPEWLVAVAASLAGYYFGERAARKKAEGPSA